GREGELSVADRERGTRIERAQRGVVARNHVAAIDAGVCDRLRGQRGGHGAEEGAAGYGHEIRVIPIAEGGGVRGTRSSSTGLRSMGKLKHALPLQAETYATASNCARCLSTWRR